MIGIYKITNKENGKIYIGQSNNIERRLKEHKQPKMLTIDDYITALGEDKFTFDILEECSLSELNDKELEYINLFHSDIDGYNIQHGGLNNSVGEGNGRSRVTEKEVEFIREAYNNHESPKTIFNKYFKDKLSLAQFQAI